MKMLHHRVLRYMLFLIALAGVTACGSGSDSPSDSSTPATPTAPANVAGVAGYQQVTLTWNAAPRATSYNVYRSTAPGVSKATGKKITAAFGTSFVDAGLTNGVTYYYVVTAVNAYGESADSNQVSAKPDVPLPPPPPPPPQ